MAFGLSSGEREESSGGESRPGGNRPDCAYFLLLGLCGAAFLLTIGGILTYIAFNPGSVDSRPHSPLSHIPHFHHHRKHHDRTEGHYFGHFEHHDELKQQHNNNNAHHAQQQQQHSHLNVHIPATTPPTNVGSLSEKTTQSPLTMPKPTTTVPFERNETSSKMSGTESTYLSGENATTPGTPGSHLETPHLNKKKEENASSIVTSSPQPDGKNGSAKENGKDGHHYHQNEHSGSSHRNYNNNKSNGTSHHHPLLDSSSSSHHLNPHQQMQHPHPGLISSVTHHHEGNNGTGYEYQAKQSLALAIIGPLCLLMGIIVTLIVGVFALRYDCDHEPEPNIAFLRLRSEMSLNFDPSKNNYELLMPASSSTAAGVGSTHSIHPGGMPRC